MNAEEVFAALAALPAVDIDPAGIFKYVQIEVTAEDRESGKIPCPYRSRSRTGVSSLIGKEETRHFVRGYARCEYHADIYDPFEEKIRGQGLDAQCLGGGRIVHKVTHGLNLFTLLAGCHFNAISRVHFQPDEKYLKVYGYSMGFGKANHERSVEILKTKYPDYKIEWSDEGY